MGLDAFVYCRCWQEGLSSSPPVGPVGFDEEGYFELSLPWEGNEAAHSAFDAWLKVACSHERMEQARQRVSNWAGVRLFQQVLRDVGWSHFPTLCGGLPDANGGSMSADQAQTVLAELELFQSTARLEDEVALVDEATGRTLMTYIAAYEGVAMLGPGYRAGVDPDGFFIRDDGADPATLFRALRFTQRPLPGGEVEFVDDDGLRARVVMSPVGGGGESAAPHQLAVRSLPRSAADFGYIVEPLRRLCEASVLTGNPVMWT